MSRISLMIVMVSIGIFGADANCGGTQLSGRNGSRNYVGTTKGTCIWKFTKKINQTTAIFIRLGSNKLRPDGGCRGDVKPTGVGREIRLCEWNPPVCFIIVYPESRCNPSMYFEKYRGCKQFSWITKNSTNNVKFSRNSNNHTLSFSFAYEYIDCQESEDHTTTSSINQNQEKCTSGSNSANLLAAIGILCFLLLAVITAAALCLRRYMLQMSGLNPKDNAEMNEGAEHRHQTSSTAEIVVNEIYEQGRSRQSIETTLDENLYAEVSGKTSE